MAACDYGCNNCNCTNNCSACTSGCNTAANEGNKPCESYCQVCQSLCQNEQVLKNLVGNFSFSPTPVANKTIFHKDSGTNHFTRASWQAIIDHINQRHSLPSTKIANNLSTNSINAGTELSDCTDTYFTHTEFNKVRDDIASHMTGATAPQVSQYQLIEAEFFTKLVSDVNKMTVSDGCSANVSCKECQTCVTWNVCNACDKCVNGECGSCNGSCNTSCTTSCNTTCQKSCQTTCQKNCQNCEGKCLTEVNCGQTV